MNTIYFLLSIYIVSQIKLISCDPSVPAYAAKKCRGLTKPEIGDYYCSIVVNFTQEAIKEESLLCTFSCPDDYAYSNGEKTKVYKCNTETGEWVPPLFIPHCAKECKPRCVHGICTSDTICLCNAGYRGEDCSKPISNCDANAKFGANGWNCTHGDEMSTCKLVCPPGTTYQFRPADKYECNLDGQWVPSKAPKCVPINIKNVLGSMKKNLKKGKGKGLFSKFLSKTFKKKKSSSTCAVWGSMHHRTFDGFVYSVQRLGTYMLAKDYEQGTFEILVYSEGHCVNASSCNTYISIEIASSVYMLVGKGNSSEVKLNGVSYPIPMNHDGMSFQTVSGFIVAEHAAIGFRVTWDRMNSISVKPEEKLRHRTCGLCGKYDGHYYNDFTMSNGKKTYQAGEFVRSWLVTSYRDSVATAIDPCSKKKKEEVAAALKKCNVMRDKKFSSCHKLVDPKDYIETCRMDHCGCESNSTNCFCESVSEYFRECYRLGGKMDGGWRSLTLCQMDCPSGMVYKDCGNSCPVTCGNKQYECQNNHCVDGCHCPDGTVLHNGECITRSDCPCVHEEIEYPPGSEIMQDCNNW